jgi:hypothetical protein
MSGAVRSGCVVVEAMQTADKYLRVLIFALLMKQLDFELYTKHLREQRRCVICEDGVPAANPSWIERVLVRVRCVVLRLGQRSSSSYCTARGSGPAHLLHMPLLHV